MTTQRGSTWKVLGIVGGVALLALGVLGGLAAVGLQWGWPSPLSQEDREVLVVAAELAPLLPELVLRSDAETFSKRRFFDGHSELAYQYVHPDPQAPLRLASRVIVAPNRAEARNIYQTLSGAFDQLADENGYTLESRDGLFTWGDASRFAVLREGEAAAGYLLASRRGEKVLVVELIGGGLEETWFGELAHSSLQALESYQP